MTFPFTLLKDASVTAAKMSIPAAHSVMYRGSIYVITTEADDTLNLSMVAAAALPEVPDTLEAASDRAEASNSSAVKARISSCTASI